MRDKTKEKMEAVDLEEEVEAASTDQLVDHMKQIDQPVIIIVAI